MSDSLIYTSDRTISSAYLDSSLHLGSAQAALMIQDNLTECYNMLDIDGIVYKERYNAFWVFTKTKIHFNRHPAWREKIKASTFPINNGALRAHINTVLVDSEGKEVVTANQEACVLDFERHRPMKLTDLNFPKEGFPNPIFTKSFERFPSDYTDGEYEYEFKVRSQQIDLSHHLNNIEYIKLGLNTYPESMHLIREISDLEMHYLGETKEGQVLRIYKKSTSEGDFIRILEVTDCKEDENKKPRIVFEMKINFYD